MVIYKAKNDVALLFDDGPNPKITPKILDILRLKDVKANFFLIGMRAEKSPDIVRQIATEGHEIGNHTYTHKKLVEILQKQGDQAVTDEVIKGRDAIAKAAGIEEDQIIFLRPPYFSWNYEVARIIEPLYGNNVVMSGLAIGDYDWDADHKWDEQDTQAISAYAKRIVDAWMKIIENGTLVGFHDSSEHNLPGNKHYDNWMNRALPTLEALPIIIDNILQKGFRICKLSEMELVREESARLS